MVQTRSQWRAWRNNNFESQHRCSECDNDNEYSNGSQMDSVDNANAYNNNNDCHRHRKQDDQPYSEEVVSYRRRKPIK
jgi:hypothetical protein